MDLDGWSEGLDAEELTDIGKGPHADWRRGSSRILEGVQLLRGFIGR